MSSKVDIMDENMMLYCSMLDSKTQGKETLLRNIPNTGRWNYSASRSRLVPICWLGSYVLIFLPSCQYLDWLNCTMMFISHFCVYNYKFHSFSREMFYRYLCNHHILNSNMNFERDSSSVGEPEQGLFRGCRSRRH